MLTDNVAFYNSSHCYTGLERNSLKIMQELTHRGSMLILFAPDNSPLSKACRIHGVNTAAIDETRRYVNLRVAYRLAKAIRKQHCGVLVILRPRDIVTAVLTKILFSGHIKLVFYQQIELTLARNNHLYKVLFSRFDAWLIIMEHMRKQVKSFSSLKENEIVHIAPCVDPGTLKLTEKDVARQKSELPVELTLMGTLTRFNPVYKLDFLIRAVQLLQKNGYSIGLLLAGKVNHEKEFAYVEFLRELARECNVENSVYFLTKTSRKENILSALNIYIHHKVSQACSTSIIEAMMTGIPVVALSTMNSTELLENGKLGLLYKEDDLTDFSARLIRLLRFPLIEEEFIYESRKTALSRYNTEKTCETMKQIFQKLVVRKEKNS
jgi:glycosyltransferase involved in cell wall biosynthesis